MNNIELTITIYVALYVFFHSLMLIYVWPTIKNYFKEKEKDEEKSDKEEVNRFKKRCSIVVSAYNEENVIVDSVKTFLNQDYPNFEVIIVDDGSTDNTVKNLIEAYNLKEVKKTVKEVYNKNHKEITTIYDNEKIGLSVIKKPNGGLSDGQNCGVQLASGELKLNDEKSFWRIKKGKSDYVLITDADCILEKDTLKKLTSAMDKDPNNVAIGSLIQMSNNCKIKDGDLKERRIPTSILGKSQLLEYFKAYFVSRIAMEPFKTVLCASGGIGLFKTDVIQKVGGFKLKSLAEDMDITMRINTYAYENGLKWKQKFIPEITCWTEVPESLGMMYKQRLRWGAGMLQELLLFKKVLFNRKYQRFGMLSYPFIVLFNWFTPIVELFGLGYFVYQGINGTDWSLFWLFVIINYIFGVVFNNIVLNIEKRRLGIYNKSDKRKMRLFTLVEPLFYHWLCSFWSVLGYFKYIIGNMKHPKIKRKGFKKFISKDKSN